MPPASGGVGLRIQAGRLYSPSRSLTQLSSGQDTPTTAFPHGPLTPWTTRSPEAGVTISLMNEETEAQRAAVRCSREGTLRKGRAGLRVPGLGSAEKDSHQPTGKSRLSNARTQTISPLGLDVCVYACVFTFSFSHTHSGGQSSPRGGPQQQHGPACLAVPTLATPSGTGGALGHPEWAS